MRGRGKTNSVKVDYSNVEPLFVVDIRNEYRHINAFYTLKAFYVWMQHNGLAKAKEEGHKLQFRFAFGTRKEYVSLFNLLTNFKDCAIIVDEADALFQDTKCEKPLIDLMLGSRNHNLDLMFIGKRPVLIPIIVRSQVDEFHVFAVAEPYDVNYIAKRTRQDFPKDPWNLAKGECIIIREGEKPTLKKYPLFKEGYIEEKVNV